MNRTLAVHRTAPAAQNIFVEIELSQTKTRIAMQCVSNSKYAEIRSLQCEVRNGILYLRGEVTSFYLKQLSQEAVRSLEGIDEISNCVEVKYPDESFQKESDQSTNEGARIGNIKLNRFL